jgi:hypothetical protein
MTHLNDISKVYMEKVAAKPDFLDLDSDGNKKEPMKKAAKEVEPPKEKLKTDRNMFNIPKGEQESARERLLRKAREKRERAKMSEALDPVGKEDDDIDNDGDVDNSDKYLHKKRKAIGKAIGKEEECEKCGKKKCECDHDKKVDEIYMVTPPKKNDKKKKVKTTIDKYGNRVKVEESKNVHGEIEEGIGMTVAKSLGNPPPLSRKMRLKQSLLNREITKNAAKSRKKTYTNVGASNTTPANEEVELLDEIHSQAHTPHEVPSGNLKALVGKAVKRIDTDVDGDTDHNDKAKGELGEFIPGVNNKRLFSSTKVKTAKESFSNWREDLIEVTGKMDKKISEKKSVDNSSIININPELKEGIASLGGTILEQNEVEYAEPVDIFEDVTDAEFYFMDEDFIYDIVEESILELLDEGYDIDYIVDSIVESVDNSLQVLEEDVAATAARKRAGDMRRAELRTRSKTMRPEPAAMRRSQRMNAVKSAAKKVGSAVKRAATGAAKGTAYGAGYAAGTAVRGARAIARKAGEGYKRGVQGSGSSSGSSDTKQRSGSSTYAPSSRDNSERGSSKPGMLSRVGSALNRGIKGAVRVGARLVRSGATSVAKGAKYVEKRMSEDCQVNAVSEYFIEEGLNEEGVAILIEELGVAEFAEFVCDLSEEIMLIEELNEARAGGVKVAPVTKTGKSVGSLKGGPRSSAIKRLRKEKAARREAEAKASATKPSGMKAALQSQSKTAAKRDAAVSKAKSAQPKKKGILDRVAGEVLKGMERHKKAMAAARETGKTISKAAKVGAKGAQEFGKGFSSGVKTTAKVAKDAKKVLSNEGYYDRRGIRRPNTRLRPGKDYGGYGGDDSTRGPGGTFQTRSKPVDKPKKKVEEEARNPYAIGMAAAMKSTGDTPPLEKSTIKKAHKIADKVKANEENEMKMSPQEAKLQMKKSKIDMMIAKARNKAIKSQS